MWILDGPRIGPRGTGSRGTGSDEPGAPALSFLVEHRRGLVLFDTGLDPAAIDDPVGALGPIWGILAIELDRGKLVVSQLAGLGLAPGDITHVITSHAHFDHCGGVGDFASAIHVIGEGEIPHAYWPGPRIGGEFFIGRYFEPLRSTTEILYLPPGTDHDLFGDGSVVVLSLPGHTVGHLGLHVALPSGVVLLSGDAVHSRAELDHPEPLPGDHDSRRAAESVDRLRRLIRAHRATVLVSHEPATADEHGPLPALLS